MATLSAVTWTISTDAMDVLHWMGHRITKIFMCYLGMAKHFFFYFLKVEHPLKTFGKAMA